MMRTLALLLLLLPLTACGNTEGAEIEQRNREVMAIHDATMAKMGVMHDLERKLSGQLATMTVASAAKAYLQAQRQRIERVRDVTTQALARGDLILTWTPSGVRPLVLSDAVAVDIENIGTLVNPVVAERLQPLPAGA